MGFRPADLLFAEVRLLSCVPPCADPLVCCVLSWSCVEAAPPSPYVLRLESLVLQGVGKVTGVAVRRCCLLLSIKPSRDLLSKQRCF